MKFIKNKNIQLLALVIFFVFLRLYPIWGGNFPFSYDNAKDNLAIFQIWAFKKIPLLGAVTSLEGLWQGPFWYYIFFFFNLLFGFQPFSNVLAVIFLGVFTLYLFWKYLGKIEAFLYAISPVAILTQQTSWAPYLTTFSTAWILVILTTIKKKVTFKQLFLLSLSFSLLFHSEIAFAFVFILPLIVILFFKKIKFSLGKIALCFSVILISFLPQVIFEVRHDFLQTRSVIRFINNFSVEKSEVWQNEKGLARVVEVGRGFVDNILGSVSPINWGIPEASKYILLTLIVLAIYLGRKRVDKEVFIISMPPLLGVFILDLFFPFKSYYLVGLVPFWIYLFGQVLKRNYSRYLKAMIIIFLIFSIIGVLNSKKEYERHGLLSRILFEPKRKAVEEAYTLSEGKRFVSYQFVPEVYDYTYQYIYEYSAVTKGRFVPLEYSYLPGETSYMTTLKLKDDSSEVPFYTILIVERGTESDEDLFSSWWGSATKGKKIDKKVNINDSITVYRLINDEKSN